MEQWNGTYKRFIPKYYCVPQFLQSFRNITEQRNIINTKRWFLLRTMQKNRLIVLIFYKTGTFKK